VTRTTLEISYASSPFLFFSYQTVRTNVRELQSTMSGTREELIRIVCLEQFSYRLMTRLTTCHESVPYVSLDEETFSGQPFAVPLQYATAFTRVTYRSRRNTSNQLLCFQRGRVSPRIGKLDLFGITNVPSRVILDSIAPLYVFLFAAELRISIYHRLLSSSVAPFASFLKGFGGVVSTVKSCPTSTLQIHKCGNENSSCPGRLATTSYTTRIAVIRLGFIFVPPAQLRSY
jgi:hypothetical protein